MKPRRLLFGLFLIQISLSGNSQEAKNQVHLRDSLYQEYRAYKDTMTVRTWINMINLNKSLEGVVLIDNELIDLIRKQDSPIPLYENRIIGLMAERDSLLRLNEFHAIEKKESEKYHIYYYAGVAALFLAFLLFLILYLINVSHKAKTKSNLDEYKRAVDLIKAAHKDELNATMAKLDEFRDERQLMQENLAAVKKAYEILKEEKEGMLAKAIRERDAKYEQLLKDLGELNEEVSSYLRDKQQIMDQLEEYKVKYQQEIQLRNEVQQEFSRLLEKLKS